MKNGPKIITSVVSSVVAIALTLAIVSNCVSLIRDAKAELGKESGFDDEHTACGRLLGRDRFAGTRNERAGRRVKPAQ